MRPMLLASLALTLLLVAVTPPVQASSAELPISVTVQPAAAEPPPGGGDGGWLSQQFNAWLQKQLMAIYDDMILPFSQSIPILMQHTPDLSQGVVAITHSIMRSVAFGLIALLFTVGWGQAATGFVLGYPTTPLQLLARAAGAAVMVAGSLRVMAWVIELVDAIVGRIIVDVNGAFTVNRPDVITVGQFFLFLIASLAYLGVMVIFRALLTFRLVDLALMMALAPIPAAFYTLPATAGLVSTWFREFVAVASQTLVFAVIIAFWDSIALAGVPGLPLTFLQHIVAFVLLGWYLWNKPHWLKAMVHSGSHDVGMGVVSAVRMALSMMGGA